CSAGRLLGLLLVFFFFFQGGDGIRGFHVTGVQTCALPIYRFCEGDILRVMRSGGICVVDSLEPYVELDGATAPDGQDPRDAGSRSEGRRVGKGGGRRWRRRDEAEMVRREHGGVGLRGAAGV